MYLLRKGAAIVMSISISFSLATAGEIEKSASDQRSYRSFTLENQLQVLVISDPETDKAAASLDIDVGSADNPVERPGIAHFLEHMLFLGTEKYPTAGEYQSYIQSNGGYHNAFTALTNTNYFFDVKPDALAPALDRFSQFFIAPLFSEEYTDRERHAVHSEYTSKLRDDWRRIWAANQQAMNPEHPASRFAVGNLATLSDTKERSIRQDLADFYQRYYSANRMTLVVLGKQPLDKLEALVSDYFSAIPNRQVAKPVISQKRYSDGALPMIVQVQTIKDLRNLTLSFPTSEVESLWQSKPLRYLASLLGYEGKGSLLAELKAEGLATALGASSGRGNSLEASLEININLTPKGLENSDQVVALFFDFIQQLKTDGIRESLYREESQLAKLQFQFLAKQEPSHYVTALSQQMRKVPQEYWLSSAYHYDKFDAEQIAGFLAQITPQNMVLGIQSQDRQGTAKAPYYDTAYSISKPTPEQLALWNNPGHNKALYVRGANPFIAEDLSLLEDEASSTLPSKHEIEQGGTLWHLKDDTFKRPRADLFFTLLTPLATAGAESLVALNLYTQMVQDALNETLYDASMAGLSTQIYPHRRGFSVRISGYNDKQPRLVETLRGLVDSEFQQSRFDDLKRRYRDQLLNQFKDKPVSQLQRLLYRALMPEPSLDEKVAAVDKLTLQELKNFARKLYQKAELRVLSHGNVSESQAIALAQKIAQVLAIKNSGAFAPDTQIVRLEAGDQLRLDASIEHNDSAYIRYLQGPDDSFSTRAATALLAEILSAPFYTQLRTEQQLGYIVHAGNMPLRRLPGLVMLVQSPATAPDKIDASSQAFIDGFADTLDKLSTDQLNGFKASLIARLDTNERSINQKSGRLWREIDFANADFDSREQLIKATEQTTKQQLQSLWQQLLSRQLILTTPGATVEKSSAAKIEQQADWQTLAKRPR